jgi:hypothetical protein
VSTNFGLASHQKGSQEVWGGCQVGRSPGRGSSGAGSARSGSLVHAATSSHCRKWIPMTGHHPNHRCVSSAHGYPPEGRHQLGGDRQRRDSGGSLRSGSDKRIRCQRRDRHYGNRVATPGHTQVPSHRDWRPYQPASSPIRRCDQLMAGGPARSRLRSLCAKMLGEVGVFAVDYSGSITVPPDGAAWCRPTPPSAIESGAVGEREQIALPPPARGWCSGTYRVTVFLQQSPYCLPQIPCPEFATRALETGTAGFTVAGGSKVRNAQIAGEVKVCNVPRH